jgi:hypothetical protein
MGKWNWNDGVLFRWLCRPFNGESWAYCIFLYGPTFNHIWGPKVIGMWEHLIIAIASFEDKRFCLGLAMCMLLHKSTLWMMISLSLLGEKKERIGKSGFGQASGRASMLGRHLLRQRKWGRRCHSVHMCTPPRFLKFQCGFKQVRNWEEEE